MGAVGKFAKNNFTLIGLGILILVFGIATPSFLQASNFIDIFKQISIYGVVAFAMTIAILCGEFDLSVSSVFALSSLLFVYFSARIGIVPAFLITVAIGAGIGTINGLLVAKARINAFIVTMSTMISVKGVALTWSNGNPMRNNDEVLYEIGNGSFLGTPNLIWILIIAFFVTFIVLRYTSFGRNIYATGGNYEVARAAGINVVFYKAIVFVILGAVAALQGCFLACRMGSGSILFGTDLAMTCVTMVVIGGSNLSGGRGSAFKTLVGILVVGVLFNALILLNIDSYWQDIIKGIILIAVISFDSLSENMRQLKNVT